MTSLHQILTIPTPKEFDFQQNLSYLARSDKECMFTVQNNTISKAISINDSLVIFHITADDTQLIVTLSGDEYFPETIQAGVRDYIIDWFDLHTNLKPFYNMASKDPLLLETIHSFSGLRMIGIPDLFEALCWGIIGQQINLNFAYTLKERFVRQFGQTITYENKSYSIFPKPEVIATQTIENLQPLQLPKRKCAYLIGVAKLLANGELSKEKLLAMPSIKEAEKTLVAIHGIGPWTANYVLMRCLRFPDAYPTGDVGLHNAIKHQLNSNEKPTKETLIRLGESWQGWQAYATFYLWRTLY